MKWLLQALVVVLVVLMCTSVLWAQTTGKISGKVLDAATGDPIPSANVVVVGTTLGATTTIQGEFFILNVPAGTHSLKVTSLGYETQTVTEVQVSVDETYELTARLKQTVLEGQEVTVVAERDVVRRDVSQTVRSVTSEEISELPVTTYQEALARTPGAVGSGLNLHIRGGRSEEVLYLVDGMPVKDPQFQRRSIGIPEDAIGEMQVLTAGYNAEYGEAQSAIVNLVIKEGDPVYHGRVQHTQDFEGDKNYQNWDGEEASLSGPEPVTQKILPRLGVRIPGSMTFFGSGTVLSRNTNDRGVFIDTDPWFRHQVTDIFGLDVRKNQTASNSTLKLTYTPQPNLKFTGGWTQAQSWENPYWYRMSRRFPDDFSPSEITQGMHAMAALQGLPTDAASSNQTFGVDDDNDGRIDEEALNWQDDDGDGLIDEDLQSYSFNANNSLRTDVAHDQQGYLTFNHSLSQRTFYTVRLSMYDADRRLAGGNLPAAQYGVASEPYTDLPNAGGVKNNHYDIGEPFVDQDGDGLYDFNNPNNTYPNVNGFAIAGYGLAGNYQQLVPAWSHYHSQSLGARADLSSQVDPRHLLKGGLEYDYYNVGNEDRPYPSINNAGKGIYTDVYRFYPLAAAGYLQDKMEYRDIIVNAGLRLDWWKIGGKNIETSLGAPPQRGGRGLENFVEYKVPSKGGEYYVSPRLGIAYSVTDRDVFHFNYGYFYQRGRQDYYFTGVNQQQTGGTPIIGNPDLRPMKTIAYELGVRHQFLNDYLFDVSTYYKDIKNWIQTASQNQLYFAQYGYSPIGSNAAIYYNADYASIRGFEINLTKQYGSTIAGRLTYTLAWATGKNSYDIGSDVTRQNYVEPRREAPLGWDRRHQIVFNLGVNYPLKGQAFSAEWLRSGWQANILSQALSGLPYTPTYVNGTNVSGQEFSLHTPWVYTTDLNASRAFKTGGLAWRVLLDVRNLFDRKNVVGWDVNPNTINSYIGDPSLPYNGRPGEPGYINDSTSPNYGLDPKAGPNPDAWDAGRLIRAGLAVEF
jgi:outer membrane receptor protein involved in Fe transport